MSEKLNASPSATVPGSPTQSIGPEPWTMTFEEFEAEYERIMQAVARKEKKGGLDPADQSSYRVMTDTEHELLARDWKAFSRSRGFSEEDIAEYERWFCLSGQRDNLDGAINDPWRRGRSDWARQLYAKHMEHAVTLGLEIPEAIALAYHDQEKEELEQIFAPVTVPLPQENQTNSDMVW